MAVPGGCKCGPFHVLLAPFVLHCLTFTIVAEACILVSGGVASDGEAFVHLDPHGCKCDLHELSAEEDFVVGVVVAVQVMLVPMVEHLANAPVAVNAEVVGVLFVVFDIGVIEVWL